MDHGDLALRHIQTLPGLPFSVRTKVWVSSGQVHVIRRVSQNPPHVAIQTTRRLRVRCTQIAIMRMPPKSCTRSPMLNSPRRAWSAKRGSRVFSVAARHIGLAGRSVEGIPTTGIVPALASVTRAFSISPQRISRTPVRTQGERTARNTSHRIAQHSHSQIAGCCVHTN
jgi:hypothetical protein